MIKQAKAQDTTEEDERGNADADDIAHREQRYREVHPCIEASRNERNGAFNGVVRDLETLHHQTVQSTDAEGVENGKRTITAFLAGHQNFSAGHAFGVRKGLLDNEQATQGNGEHGA